MSCIRRHNNSEGKLITVRTFEMKDNQGNIIIDHQQALGHQRNINKFYMMQKIAQNS